jgi:hypothetical protein
MIDHHERNWESLQIRTFGVDGITLNMKQHDSGLECKANILLHSCLIFLVRWWIWQIFSTYTLSRSCETHRYSGLLYWYFESCFTFLLNRPIKRLRGLLERGRRTGVRVRNCFWCCALEEERKSSRRGVGTASSRVNGWILLNGLWNPLKQFVLTFENQFIWFRGGRLLSARSFVNSLSISSGHDHPLIVCSVIFMGAFSLISYPFNLSLSKSANLRFVRN